MPLRLVAVSAATLLFLVGGLSLVVFSAAVLAGANTPTLIGLMVLTVAGHAVMFFLSPWLTDLIQRWVYEIEEYEFHAFEARYPYVGGAIRQICEYEEIPLPRMRVILDDNPTAYTYGSFPSNARMVLSRGMFRFCDDREVAAVAAHELGHIRHYDFAVMTLASLLLSLLYEAYFVIRHLRKEEGDNRLMVVAWVAYALWWAGFYAVRWLSRTREYMADRFAAEMMGDPQPLQRALVKIAYGLAELKVEAEARGDTGSTRLLDSTRALGIADPKGSATVGTAVRVTGGGVVGNTALAEDPYAADQASTAPAGTSFDPAAIEPVFLFDLFNPWASVTELESTHPLTGKRLRELNELSEAWDQAPLFRFDAITAQGAQLDQQRLYGTFAFEVIVWFLPWITATLTLAVMGLMAPAYAPGAALMAWGVGHIGKGIYAFAGNAAFQPTTVYELMCDPYASPLRGQPVVLEGEVVGKAEAGSKVAADVQLKDTSGGLMYLNFQHAIPWLGDLFFGLTGAQKAIGRQAKARGWFRRGVGQYVDLYDLEVGRDVHGSWTRFWAMWGGTWAIAAGLVVLLLGGVFQMAMDAVGGAAPQGEPTEQGVQQW